MTLEAQYLEYLKTTKEPPLEILSFEAWKKRLGDNIQESLQANRTLNDAGSDTSGVDSSTKAD